MSTVSPAPAPGSNVAVVGGTGFLGAHIVRALAGAGYRPVVITRHPSVVIEALPDLQVEARAADVLDVSTLAEAMAGCAAVHSTVALVDQAIVLSSPEAEQRLIHTNVEGGLNVVRAAHAVGARRVILTGSASVRYSGNGAVSRESSPQTSLDVVNDAYVRSKLALERQGHELATQLGVTLSFTLPGALYGPGDRLPSLFGSTIVARINGNTEPTIQGGMPLVDVRDVASAHVRIMELAEPAPAYLLVAETCDTRRWNDLISKLAGAPPVEQYIAPKAAFVIAGVLAAASKLTGKPPRFTRNMVQHVAINQHYDCSLAREQLGITFRSTEETLADAIAWFREHENGTAL